MEPFSLHRGCIIFDVRNPLAPIVVGSGLIITVNTGNILLAGVPTTIPSTVIALTQSATNFVHITSGGAVAVNTSSFPATSLPIAQVICSQTSITSIIDSRPDFSLPSSSGSFSFLSPAGTILPNLVFRNVYKNITATGNTDLYTCPTNKRAIACEIALFNNSGVTITSGFYATIKVSGTYYQSTPAATVSNLTNGSRSSHYILEAGETIAVNVNQQPCNVWGGVMEFDNTSNLKSAKLTAFVVGDNTVYTVPVGKTSVILPNTFTSCNGTIGTLSYGNSSGTTRSITFNVVNSGGSPGTTNQIAPTTSVPSPNILFSPSITGFTMVSGDFFSINTDGTQAGQFGFATMVEI